MCEYCFGPLEAEYAMDRVARVMSRRHVKKGPASIWRYADILPVEMESPVELAAGYTPLLRADRLARELGLKYVFLKNECANPTGSFKDRMVAVAVSKALEFGYKTLACASSGNLAHSLAAHCARAGLGCVIFLPSDIEPSLATAAGVYGAEIITVKGTPAEINRLCTEAASRTKWAFINVHLRPFYAEGAKTLAYELCEQFDWQIPGNVIMPLASGALLTGTARGFKEMRRLNLAKGMDVRLFGVQAEGCSPIVKAFDGKTSVILPTKPKTIAKSLSVGNPADGIYALDAIRESGGAAVSVPDEEIMECTSMLARTEGIYSDPSGGAVVAAARRLVKNRKIRVGEQVVLVIPGKGSTSQEQVQNLSTQPHGIDPTMEALMNIIPRIEAKTARVEHDPDALTFGAAVTAPVRD